MKHFETESLLEEKVIELYERLFVANYLSSFRSRTDTEQELVILMML
jgi:hypothetical protein